MNEAIGGYFELELSNGSELHRQAIRLGSGRMAFEVVLKARGYQRVYMPYYICNSLIEPVKKLGLEIRFYPLDDEFYPLMELSGIRGRDVLLYVNYFGICNRHISRLMSSGCNLILDHAHSFFTPSFQGVDAFNSARKFFGVPDGSYLFTDLQEPVHCCERSELSEASHLTGRIESGAEAFYPHYLEHEQSFRDVPVQRMSRLSRRILKGVDYEQVRKRRIDNFYYLDRELNPSNRMHIELTDGSVPMVYPYLCEQPGIRERLIQRKIYTARYWKEVCDRTKPGIREYEWAHQLIPLPVDQRYGREEMNKILEVIADG